MSSTSVDDLLPRQLVSVGCWKCSLSCKVCSLTVKHCRFAKAHQHTSNFHPPAPLRFVIKLRQDLFTEFGVSSSECVVTLDHWGFFLIVFLSLVTSVRTRSRADVAPCSVVAMRQLMLWRAVGSWGLAGRFCAVLSGWFRFVSSIALLLVFLCRLAEGSFKSVIAGHWLHVVFFSALAIFWSMDAGTVLVDDVEGLTPLQLEMLALLRVPYCRIGSPGRQWLQVSCS